VLAQAQAFTPPTGSEYMRILPELILSLFGMIVMVVDPLLDEGTQPEAPRHDWTHRRAGSTCLHIRHGAIPGHCFWSMVRVDGFSVFFHVLVIAIAAVAILSSYEYIGGCSVSAPANITGLSCSETVGMCLMSSAIELVLIFIALEISSISTYIWPGSGAAKRPASESSLKYFLLGSFATAFFLYGVADDVWRNRLHQH